jgi:hypothetical protein
MTYNIAELEKLASLHERNLLTDLEFENEKRRLLQNPAEPAAEGKRAFLIIFGLLASIAVAYVGWNLLHAPNPNPTSNIAEATPQEAGDSQEGAPAAPDVSKFPTEVKTPDAIPEIGNCHMGECSWSKIEVYAAAGKSSLGSLFRLELLGGVSEHESVDEYPTSYSPAIKIKWDEHPHTVYVFCSERLPAVLMKTDGTTQVDVLDFTDPTGVPDVLTSSANLYSQTCHMNSAEWTKPDFATRFGYSSPSQYADLSLSNPTDILTVR